MTEPRKTSRTLALSVGGMAALMAALVIYEGDRNVVYLDHTGIPTVCVGVVKPGLRVGQVFTDAQCRAMEAEHIEKMLARMSKCVTEPIGERELIAYAHFVYNVGETAFCRSHLVVRLNEGNHRAACAQMARWTWAGGKNCRDPANRCMGLAKRRDYEVNLCMEAL